MPEPIRQAGFWPAGSILGDAMSETELNVVPVRVGGSQPLRHRMPVLRRPAAQTRPDLELGGDGGLELQNSRAARSAGKRRPGRRHSTVRAPAGPGGFPRRPALGHHFPDPDPRGGLDRADRAGNALEDFGGVIVPVQSEWWRILTAPFAYLGVWLPLRGRSCPACSARASNAAWDRADLSFLYLRRSGVFRRVGGGRSERC